jgi:transposase
VGDTRRRLSFFVMVLAWSRQMYVEFTLSQTMEQFLGAHVNAFNALGVPRKVMVDNLRCAVLRHPRGERAEFNPRYVDFARHFGFEIVACAVAKGNEKAGSSAASATSRATSSRDWSCRSLPHSMQTS